ncbi:MAG: DsbA family protein [Proteobacteria bacterium]|nr:DsbA family protein [Pseudomonadota bacterium]
MTSHYQALNNSREGKLIFMTDPFCSWCWGTLPEILAAKSRLGERLDFQLRCAGLQVVSGKPLGEAHMEQLLRLWREVAAITGQRFACAFPADAAFIYHSELACRAIMLARQYLGKEPWELFYSMQKAFYVDAVNIGDLDALFGIIETIGINRDSFLSAMTETALTEATRREFDWCRARGIDALPTVFLDTGQGPVLVCGGYVTADYLVTDLLARLGTH